jgi:lipopolysaccharide transport system ATP-binding protein
MPSLAIQIGNLSKQYPVGGGSAGYRTFRETVTETLTAPYRAARRLAHGRGNAKRTKPRFWALKDICLDVQEGEVIGIIGRNGAGKSTLLKVLSKITEPTAGYADVYGRVGTLLEVGTGFHPELTGRENIYLNGAILGMKRKDIDRQFDVMVAFAEVEKFIDTAVKHYSTGMYLRLAFAVAAHLDPDILFVDEVLAVGDISFQKKCLGKMGDVARQGRTVLFVSHNMGAIRSLCNRGVVLHEGRIHSAGDISTSVEDYYKLVASADPREEHDSPGGFSFGAIQLNNQAGATIANSEPCEISTLLRIGAEVAGFTLLCVLDDMHQRRVFQMRRDSSDFEHSGVWQGRFRVRVRLPTLWLEPGLYSLYFKILLWGDGGESRYLSDVFHLDVGGESCGWGSIVSPRKDWSVEREDSPAEEAAVDRLHGVEVND